MNIASPKDRIIREMCKCGLYFTRCVINCPRHDPSPKNAWMPTRLRAPLSQEIKAVQREKNSKSNAVSTPARRARQIARAKPIANCGKLLVGTSSKFSGGTKSITRKISPLSANAMNQVFSLE